MKITVTAEDICIGQRGNPGYCPVALAIKRAAKVKHVSVGSTEVTMGLPLKMAVRLPSEAQRFIRSFDRRQFPLGARASQYKPFSFDLDV